jgi:RNA 2',3'-cyclic 3'-phosphodiesterase
MAGRRIFIAIDISDAARAVCAAHIERLRRQFPKVRVGWDRPEKLHITLKFLGDTDVDLVEQVVRGASEVAIDMRPFQLSLSRPGVFPGASRPRILWIGVDDRTDAISQLNRRVEDVCEQLGFEKEKKRFHPHITIGHMREPYSALAKAHMVSPIEPIDFAVDGLVVYESRLLKTGSAYSVVARAMFSE